MARNSRESITGPNAKKKKPTRLGWRTGAAKKNPAQIAPPVVPRWPAFVFGFLLFAAAGRQWVVPALGQPRNPPQKKPFPVFFRGRRGAVGFVFPVGPVEAERGLS